MMSFNKLISQQKWNDQPLLTAVPKVKSIMPKQHTLMEQYWFPEYDWS